MRAGGGRKMQNRIEVTFNAEIIGDILTNKSKARMNLQLRKVIGTARDEIVEGDDLVAAREKVIAQVRADKAGASRDQNTHRCLDLHKQCVCSINDNG